ncbi:MAG: cysteine synthase A [Lepagella sp.]
MIYSSITELVGKTPMVEISGMEGQKATIVAKLESFNPGRSVKDRIALAMIEDAEKRGILKPGATIIEPTSGNTGIGLAMAGASKGYNTILTMPDTMSIERRNLLKAYGAQIELTPGELGMKGSIARAEELRKAIPGSVILGQFVNPANPKIHQTTTGEEIWKDSQGWVDIFVAGVGTGGTISGTGKTLKNYNPHIKVVAVEPASSAVITTGIAGKHKIQGIGAGFIPQTYDASIVDEVITISDQEAFDSSRMLARKYGLLVGISSGAAFAAALTLARKPENEGRMIVVLFPDTGERYLSTHIFD